MYSTLLSSFRLLLSLSTTALAAPYPSPETVGSGGTCFTPVVTVSTVNKLKQGPWLVTGARADANPGGAASFTKAYTVSTTITGGGGLILSADYEKIATLGLAISPNFEISTTTGTTTSDTVICPSNTGSGTNDTITWGLQYYQYSYEVTGTKTYGGYNPLMNQCDADEIEHREGGTFPYDVTFPAKQAGSQDDASGEVEFQCCTDTESDPVPGSPVCPAAS